MVDEHANIWNCPNNAALQLPQKLDTLKRHCEAIGRDPADIEISEQCIVLLGRDEADLHKKTQFAQRALGSVFDVEQTASRGTPEQLIDNLRARSQQGVTFFTMLFGDLNQPETIALFAEKVAPALVSGD